MTLNWRYSMRVGEELITKVDSPTPKTDSWPTWPGSNRKFCMASGWLRVIRNVLMLGVSSITSRMVAMSGEIQIGCVGSSH